MAVGGIEATLLSLHEMAAAALSTPELRLTGDEAHRLALAIENVNRHYPLPALRPGHQALIMLAVTCGSVYRGKIAAVRTRKRGRPGGEPSRAAGAAGNDAAPGVVTGIPATAPVAGEGGWLPPLQ